MQAPCGRFQTTPIYGSCKLKCKILEFWFLNEPLLMPVRFGNADCLVVDQRPPGVLDLYQTSIALDVVTCIFNLN